MQIELFYNAGQADVLPLESHVGVRNARILARQMSNCALLYSVRLRTEDGNTEDFRDGASEHD